MTAPMVHEHAAIVRLLYHHNGWSVDALCHDFALTPEEVRQIVQRED